MRSLARRAWQRWAALAAEVGEVQGRLLFGLLYFVAAGPVALGMRAGRSRATGAAAGASPSFWRPVERQTLSLDSARRQH